jgi:hypothetical protein
MPEPTIITEVASVFLKALKETPRQMVAPYIAAWKELVKNATPPERRNQRPNHNQRFHSGPV